MALSILLTLTLFLLPHGNILPCSSSPFHFHFSFLVFVFIFQLRPGKSSSPRTVTPSPPCSTATSITPLLTSSSNDPFLPISSFSILSTALSTQRNSPFPKVPPLPFLSFGVPKFRFFFIFYGHSSLFCGRSRFHEAFRRWVCGVFGWGRWFGSVC